MANLPDRRTCGTYDIHAALMRTNVDYARARASIEAQAAALGSLEAPSGPTVIPVVVHVIHRGGPENISDAQIQTQIDVLNRDYRKTNPDTSKVPAPFKPLVADAFVEFV